MKNRIAQLKEIKRRNEGEEFLQIICKIIETKLNKTKTQDNQHPNTRSSGKEQKKRKEKANS